MDNYKIRHATLDDIPFIADVIIAAEKGNSNNLSFSTLFEIPEAQAKQYIIDILDEEIEGCEFSIDNFLVTELDNKPVAAYGAWIEAFDDNPPSKLLKSNLISFTFPKESLKKLVSKTEIISDILIEREPLTLQFEYLYVVDGHRGKRLANSLENRLVELARQKYPKLKKAQFQLFANNRHVIKLFEKLGYTITKSAMSDHEDIEKYLPYNEKLLMEKYF